MILNQLNNIKTTTSNQFADCIDITIEDSGSYTINLQPTTEESKVLCLCITDDSVNEFDLSLTGDIDHESVVMSGLESHLTLHAYGNKWKVVGSRHTNITN